MPLSRAILDAPADAPLAIPKCPEGTTAAMEQIDLDKVIARNWEQVKRTIAERDKYRCRLCGKACRYNARRLEDKADPHHIVLASALGDDSTANTILLCRICHDLVHSVKRFFLSGNADELDELGKGLVKVERQTESGFEVVGWI